MRRTGKIALSQRRLNSNGDFCRKNLMINVFLVFKYTVILLTVFWTAVRRLEYTRLKTTIEDKSKNGPKGIKRSLDLAVRS